MKNRKRNACQSFMVVNISSYCKYYVCPTCTEGRKDNPVVERLSCTVVILQKHTVRRFSFSGVKYRLHLQ